MDIAKEEGHTECVALLEKQHQEAEAQLKLAMDNRSIEPLETAISGANKCGIDTTAASDLLKELKEVREDVRWVSHV